MRLPDTIVINVHTDPLNSYFEVSSSLVAKLGISLSFQSFISPDNAIYYLECGHDAELFILALSEHNISFQFEEIDHCDLAFFRNYRTAMLLHLH